MSAFDPQAALDALLAEYSARASAIRQDLARSHSPDFAEQALQRQNDEVLEALLAEHRQHGGMSALQMPSGFIRNATYEAAGR